MGWCAGASAALAAPEGGVSTAGRDRRGTRHERRGRDGYGAATVDKRRGMVLVGWFLGTE